MAMRIAEIAPERWQTVRALIMDVDGVLTDAGIMYTATGEEIKAFNAKDGAGIKYWHRVGHVSGILTGRSSPIVERRAAELDIPQVVMGAKNKLEHLDGMLAGLQVSPEECVYVGDDLPDIPVMRAVGVSVAVADAVDEVKDFADGVTERCGGRGAVREVVETILRAQGKWQEILARYFPAG